MGDNVKAPYETTCCPYRKRCAIPNWLLFFTELDGFDAFSRDSIDFFYGFARMWVVMLKRPMKQFAAFIEILARSQQAVIRFSWISRSSWDFIIFMDLQGCAS